MGHGNFFTQLISTLQGSEHYLDPGLEFMRRDIEKKTGLPLTASNWTKTNAPAPQSSAAAADNTGADASYRGSSAVGGGPGTGADKMVTINPNAAAAVLGTKTLLGM